MSRRCLRAANASRERQEGPSGEVAVGAELLEPELEAVARVPSEDVGARDDVDAGPVEGRQHGPGGDPCPFRHTTLPRLQTVESHLERPDLGRREFQVLLAPHRHLRYGLPPGAAIRGYLERSAWREPFQQPETASSGCACPDGARGASEDPGDLVLAGLAAQVVEGAEDVAHAAEAALDEGAPQDVGGRPLDTGRSARDLASRRLTGRLLAPTVHPPFYRSSQQRPYRPAPPGSSGRVVVYSGRAPRGTPRPSLPCRQGRGPARGTTRYAWPFGAAAP